MSIIHRAGAYPGNYRIKIIGDKLTLERNLSSVFTESREISGLQAHRLHLKGVKYASSTELSDREKLTLSGAADVIMGIVRSSKTKE